MPEIPEISNRAREMKAALSGKTIRGIEVLQPKSSQCAGRSIC